jgi:hypothetical protein
MGKMNQTKRERLYPGIHQMFFKVKQAWPKCKNSILWQSVYIVWKTENVIKPQVEQLQRFIDAQKLD